MKNKEINKSGIKILEKKVGETPLQVLNNFKKENSEYENIKMAYAGRLDPMAEGKLLVLIGETCKERDKYLGLDKEYEFEILLDFKSDSQDVLGLSEYEESSKKFSTDPTEVVQTFLGEHNWEYPIFSSKTVQGKPLFLWALEGRISEIEIPKKEIEIYELEFLESRLIEKEKLKEEIFTKINSIPEVKEESKKLGADFRRAKIRQRWNEIFNKIPENYEFQILKFRCQCSSGTYMRILAEKIAQKLGHSGLAFSIRRTKFLNLDL